MGWWGPVRIRFQGELQRESGWRAAAASLGAFVNSGHREIAENVCPGRGSWPVDGEAIRTSEVSWGISEETGDLRNLKNMPGFCIYTSAKFCNCTGQKANIPNRVSGSLMVLWRQNKMLVSASEKGPSDHSGDSVGNLGGLCPRVRS